MESRDAQAPICISPAALEALLAQLGGGRASRASELALEAAGRRWGRHDQVSSVYEGQSPRERVLEGLERLRSHGLARAQLDEFSFRPQRSECRLVCKLERGSSSDASAEQIRHLLAGGYLAGWTASVTGLEVACELLRSAPGEQHQTCSIASLPRSAPEDTQSRDPDAPVESDVRDLGLGLQDLLEVTLDSILFLDATGHVRYWNRGATLMFGYEPSEVLGRDIGFLIPRDLLQAGEVERLKETCREQGAVFNHVTRRLHKDGSVRWVSLSRAVSRDERGRELGIVATLRDVTEQRDRERELQRSRSLALVGELAAKIAHEVKNPLAGIHAALQVLEGSLEASDPRREVFASIGEEVTRLNGLTQELLRFGRPLEPQLKVADLTAFLRALVRDLEHLSMAAPGEIELGGLEPGLRLAFDPTLTGQVFKNLIMNGLQASGGHGPVRLSSRRHARSVSIDVADEGPGIPKLARDSIFEPFFTTKSRGTGLGLSIARKNVEAQGGTIRLRSHPGRGAIFRVEFPSPLEGAGNTPV